MRFYHIVPGSHKPRAVSLQTQVPGFVLDLLIRSETCDPTWCPCSTGMPGACFLTQFHETGAAGGVAGLETPTSDALETGAEGWERSIGAKGKSNLADILSVQPDSLFLQEAFPISLTLDSAPSLHF